MSHPGQRFPQHQIVVHLPDYAGGATDAYSAAPMQYQQEQYLPSSRPARQEPAPAPQQEDLYYQSDESYINPSQNVDRLAPLGSWNRPPPMWPPRRSVPISRTGSALKKTTTGSASVLSVAQRISAAPRAARVGGSRPIGSGALRPTPTQLMSGRSTPTQIMSGSGRTRLTQMRSSMSGRSTPTQLLASMSGRSTPTQLLTGTQSPTQLLSGTQSPTQLISGNARPTAAAGRRGRRALRCVYSEPDYSSQPQLAMPEYLDRRLTASQGAVHRIW